MASQKRSPNLRLAATSVLSPGQSMNVTAARSRTRWRHDCASVTAACRAWSSCEAVARSMSPLARTTEHALGGGPVA